MRARARRLGGAAAAGGDSGLVVAEEGDGRGAHGGDLW